MKNLKSSFFILLFPFLANSQQLSGLWVGALTNDSLTVRKDQTFEMALTEYRGKVYGYSYSTFIVSDTLYYIVKRVKGVIENGLCEVSDDEIVSNNFYGRRDKGVRQTTIFKLNPVDSTWYIDGKWKTDATKKFYALTGGITLKEEKDPGKSKLFEHLGDLNLIKTLSLTSTTENRKEVKPKQEIKKDIAKTKEKRTDKKNESDIAKNKLKDPETNEVADDLAKQAEKKDMVKIENDQILDKKTNEAAATFEVKKPETKISVAEKPIKKVKKDLEKISEKSDSKNRDSMIVRNEIKNPESRNENKEIRIIDSVYVFNELKRTEYKLKPPAALVNERVSAPSETIFFKQDSLILSLYDNGEVDGDTVSVLLNGDVIIAKQGLKSSAFKKTIYISPDESDSILLVLYAENLGLYPPNTGLLIIKDGEETYQVRFKADYDRNAAIMLRRKYK